MFQETYQIYQQEVEKFLQGLFVTQAPYSGLQEAMRYSLLGGGKRIRPVLTIAFARLFGGDWHKAVPFGCALELVHTYSLIHDDLPCMDDDALRRGKPTCHVAFGETLAVLAGDALQPEAFAVLASAEGMSDHQRIEAVSVLAEAAGADGMVAGQVLDTLGMTGDEEKLRLMVSLKTGAMIRGAALLGCVAANASAEQRVAAARYAEGIGMAFQIRDDMLDVIADQAEFGKPIGSDRAEGKITFADMLGIDGCAQAVEAYTAQAREAIAPYAGNEFLLALANYLAARNK